MKTDIDFHRFDHYVIISGQMNRYSLSNRVRISCFCVILTLFDKIFFQMFNQNRIYRVFQLINYLKARPAKSIKNITRFLNTSERTVYRYLDMLSDLGFTIEKDGANRIWITCNHDTLPFTEEESDYLEKLIRSSGKRVKLADSVLQKIHQRSEVNVASKLVFNAHLSLIVEQISLAIIQGRQLLIRNYSSANSQTVTDRIVEPMCFTDNYESLSAFELKSRQNKYFNIERMGAVEVLDRSVQFEKLHKFYKPDIFGYQGNQVDKEIELDMSLRAYLMMKEEFPMSTHFIRKNPDTDRYHLKCKVQSFQAPGRFVMGFAEDIQILGSKEFIRHIKRIIKNNF